MNMSEILNDTENKVFNAYLFKEYLESNGFNIENYRQMLELNKDVNGSLSLLLKDYQHFLLSMKVNYSELEENNMFGAKGYVEEDGLFVPKSLEGDQHFLGGYLPKVPYKRIWYHYPKIGDGYSEYDVTVSNGLSSDDKFSLLLKSDMDLYLGDVLDISDKNYKINRIKLLFKLELLKTNMSNAYLTMDLDSSLKKEYILLTRKK